MPKIEYPDVEKVVDDLNVSLQSTLSEKLLALYLFGSAVSGDFDPQTSDVDLLAITEASLSDTELDDLRRTHETFINAHPRWKGRIEVAYVDVESMQKFKTSTVTIVRISPGEPLHFRDMDKGWAMDWYVVQELGLTLYGPKPDTYIPHITKDEFIASIKDAYLSWVDRAKEARWIGYQSYIIMSLCRGLYAIRYGRQISKPQGASWAAKEFPEWASLIHLAEKWHGSPDKSDSLETQKETIEFAKFMTAKIL